MYPSQQAEGEDELKKRQLMELAIINGTYRDSSSKASSAGELHVVCLCLDTLVMTISSHPQDGFIGVDRFANSVSSPCAQI